MRYEITGRGLLVLSILIAALVLGAISVSAALGSGTGLDAPDLPVIDRDPMPSTDNSEQLTDNSEGNDETPTPEPEPPTVVTPEPTDPPIVTTPEPIEIPTPTPAPATPAPTPDDSQQTQWSEK
ncbi:MAG: hypothetical protein FWH16_01935 [Oscillospiraceae bacterium]|nr:hypothetical protein [Oscillospiraceae bacterium]